jgi:protein-S-isoprenylcysteine O-methyltransferase Ste14
VISRVQPLAFVSPYVFVFWAVFFVAYLPEMLLLARARATPGMGADRGSMAFIILASWFAIPAAFIVSPWSRFALLHHRSIWFAVGLVLLLAGSALRRYCFRTLGRYFTGNVRVQPDQPVIEKGLYRVVRHPSYTGGLVMYLGTGLALTNWLSVSIIVGVGVVTYAYRVYVEEQALATAMGQPYLDYMIRTKRFIPFIF